MTGKMISMTNIGNSTQENQTIALADGRTYGFADYGDTEGEPLIYLHGSGNCRYEALCFHDFAKQHNVRIISVDRPGMGLSSFHENRTLSDTANDIVQLADHLNLQQFSVAGTSGGAPHALACAYHAHDRIKNCVILVPIGPRTPNAVGWDAKQSAIYNIVRWFPSLFVAFSKSMRKKIMDRSYIARNVDKFPGCDADKKLFLDDNVQPFLSRITQEGLRQGYRGLVQEMQIFAQKGEIPWGFRIQDLPASVRYTMWIGNLDDLYLHGKDMASKLPNCDCREFEELGHLSAVFHNRENIVKRFASTVA